MVGCPAFESLIISRLHMKILHTEPVTPRLSFLNASQTVTASFVSPSMVANSASLRCKRAGFPIVDPDPENGFGVDGVVGEDALEEPKNLLRAVEKIRVGRRLFEEYWIIYQCSSSCRMPCDVQSRSSLRRISPSKVLNPL